MREFEDTKTGFSPLSIGLSLLLFVAIGAGGAFLYQQMSNSAPTELVVLKADQSAFKKEAEAEDKEKTAEETSTVYVLLDELKSSKEDVEVLSLEPSAPELPEVKVEEEAAAKTDAKTASETAAIAVEAEGETAAENNAEAIDLIQETEPAAPAKRPVEAPIIKDQPTSDEPSMMVQLAAFRDQQKAQQIASVLTQKHGERLQGLSLGVMQIDTGSSGIFWRVITEPVPNEDARGLCDALKRAGQDCILRKVDVR